MNARGERVRTPCRAAPGTQRERRRKTNGEESLDCIYRASINQLTRGYANIANTRRNLTRWLTNTGTRSDETTFASLACAHRGRCVRQRRIGYKVMATWGKYKQQLFLKQRCTCTWIGVSFHRNYNLWFVICDCKKWKTNISRLSLFDRSILTFTDKNIED